MNALRRGAIDAIKERFDPAVVWVAVSGAVACSGRPEVLEWLRASGRGEHRVAALELVASESRLVVGIQDPSLDELAGVRLAGRLYVVFSVADGRITHIHDYPQRAAALDAAGLADHRWH